MYPAAHTCMLIGDTHEAQTNDSDSLTCLLTVLVVLRFY